MFLLYLDQKNAGLMSRRDFFQNSYKSKYLYSY